MSPEDYKVDRWGIFKGKKRHFNVCMDNVSV
jgi:hypothetical protein